MAIQYDLGHRNASMTDIATRLGINAVIKIFSGTPPANNATADSGVMLVTFAGNATQFGTVNTGTGVLTASIVANAVGAAGAGAGTNAGYYRAYPSAATTTNAVIQGTAGISGTDMILTNSSIASGQTCTFGPLTITAFGA